MLCLGLLTSSSLVGSKNTQQEFTSHRGASVTKSCLNAAEDTLPSKKPPTKRQRAALPQRRRWLPAREGASSARVSGHSAEGVGRRTVTSSPRSPRGALSPQQGGGKGCRVPLWRLLPSGESSSRRHSRLERTGEVLQKVLLGNALLLKATAKTSLC